MGESNKLSCGGLWTIRVVENPLDGLVGKFRMGNKTAVKRCISTDDGSVAPDWPGCLLQVPLKHAYYRRMVAFLPPVRYQEMNPPRMQQKTSCSQ